MKQKSLYPIFLKPDTGSCNFFTVSMNTFRIFAQKKETMAKIVEMTYCDKLHKSLLKKEAVSPLEVIYNNHNQLGYNVVRRPAGQCLGNLKYFNHHRLLEGSRALLHGLELRIWSLFPVQ